MNSHNEFQQIPGVGKKMCQNFIDLGFRSISELAGADPESMYHNIIKLRGKPVDRCVLYVYRCAVYFVSTSDHEPERLKWWNWKDDNKS